MTMHLAPFTSSNSLEHIMPTRNTGNLMPHRQYVNTTVYDRLYTKRTFHIDAWLWQMRDDVLYLVMESRAGGQMLLERNVYRVGETEGIVAVRDEQPERDGIARHIDSPWARKHAPWLNRVHHTLIQPTLRIEREGFKGHVSVRLHYVWSDPTLDDPMRGIENLYAITGRRERDAARASVQEWREGKGAPIAAAWSARDRSMLRTLDKILKG